MNSRTLTYAFTMPWLYAFCTVLALAFMPEYGLCHPQNQQGSSRSRQECSFENALEFVLANTAECVVAEDAPLDCDLTKQELTEILRTKQSVADRITAIANRFDYSVNHRGN